MAQLKWQDSQCTSPGWIHKTSGLPRWMVSSYCSRSYHRFCVGTSCCGN